ncbi:MAG: hypothetical protein GY796_13765 [Chloroflexi bacterium]|nr:hypothetical protein [Chloroflexota bacterium]
MTCFSLFNNSRLRLGSLLSLGLLFLLTACNDDTAVPTSVPQANLPQVAPVVVGTPAPTPEMLQAEPGTLAPLPSLEGQVGGVPGLDGAVDTAVGGDTVVGIVFTDPFSSTTFTLNAPLPESPGETAVLRHQQSGKISLEAAAQLAQKFGFDGTLYQEAFPDASQLEPGLADFTPPTIYYAFDNAGIFSIDPWSANYHNGDAPYDVESRVDFTTASQAAESFLQEHSLLDFPYTIQQGFGSDLFFMRQIDGRAANQPEIVVSVNNSGQVSYVSYQVMQNLEDMGTYPLILAEEAWARLQSGVVANSIPYTLYPADGVTAADPFANEFQSWTRQYQPGETVQLYGWPNVYLPANGSGTARVQIFPYLMTGADETLNQIAEAVGQQINVNGVINEDGKGILVNDWSVANELEPLSLQGTIQRQGEQVQFAASDGQTYLLPDPPADLPDEMAAFVFAWTSQQSEGELPLLQWESIDKSIMFEEETAATEPGNDSFFYNNVTLDDVTLAYYLTYIFPAVEPDQISPATQPTVILQPAWKFSGTADNEEKVEFYVQAVTGEFVQE